MTDEERQLEIRQQKEERKEKRQKELQKIRSLHGKARLQYLWDYYKIVILFVLIAAAAVYIATRMIHGLMTDTVLQVGAISADYFGTSDQIKADFAQYAGGLKKNQELSFDLSVDLDPDDMSQAAQIADVKLQVAVSAETLDAVLVPDRVFPYLQQRGMLMDLRQVLSADEISRYQAAGDLAYLEPPDETALSEQQASEDRTMDPDMENTISMIMAMNESVNGQAGPGQETEGPDTAAGNGAPGEKDAGPVSTEEEGQESETAASSEKETEEQIPSQPAPGLSPYGVRVDDSGVLLKYGWYPEGRRIYLGIVNNAKNTEMAHTFLDYLKGVSNHE